MPRYVDGFVIPIKKKNLSAYRRAAQKSGKIWRKYGALDFVECVGDDLKHAGVVPFPRQLRTKAGETVLFSWIVFKSKAHRNSVNAKVMKDPTILKMMGEPMPFDGKRMVYGGFKVLVDL
jgi:uncharacterized protein YbaA (DUF1428 family)